LNDTYCIIYHTSELGGPQVNAVRLCDTVVSAGNTEVVQVTAAFVGADITCLAEVTVVATLKRTVGTTFYARDVLRSTFR